METIFPVNPANAFFKGLRPEERLTVSEWADKYRIVAGGPTPGPYRTDKTPYLKEIMDCLSSRSTYREVIYMKAAQIGASEAGFNWLGYKMDISPAVILAVMPTEGQMKRNSKLRIDPMIKSTPRLFNKISGNSRDSTNTILQKEFPGGSLVMAGANSASGLRSIPAEALMLDEVDAYPADLDGEGSPIKLAQARNRNFKRGKTFMPSTPTVKNSSIIEREWEKTDKRKYHMPCPHCGTMQHLEWINMRWIGNDSVTSPSTAYYQCPHCEGQIYEKHKRTMLAHGQWIATDPDRANKYTAGFHNNSLVSPWYSWEMCVKDFLEAENDETAKIVFTNTVLGETSKASGDAPEWNSIYNKSVVRKQNQPPIHVKMITMGVDVQKNRLALHIVGWGYDKRRWVIDYREIPGDVETDEAWKQLRDIINNEKFIREDGLEMSIHMTAIDSGYQAKEVYDFCKPFSRTQVVPIKGVDNQRTVFSAPQAVNKTEAGKKAGNVMLYAVGSSMLKKNFYGKLRLDKTDEDPLGPPGYVHLIRFDETYFRGIVAEEERITYPKGKPFAQWWRIFLRNEPLDTMNYAEAAAAIAGIDRFNDEWLDKIEASYEKKTPVKKKTVKDITLSPNTDSYWD